MEGKIHGKQILDYSIDPQKLTFPPITGSGSSGYIPLFDGTYSVGTSSIFQSGGSVSVYNPMSVNTLTITGSFSYIDGNQSAGKVLTVDANGYATWQTPTGGGTTMVGSSDIGILFYLTPSVNSDIPGYYLASESPTGGTTVAITQSISGTGPNLIGSFATPLGSPNVTSLPTGIAGRLIHSSVGGANQYAKLYLELYKRTAGGTETLLRSDYSDPFNNTVVDEIIWTHTGTASYPLDPTDRIVFKLYSLRVDGSPTNINVYTYYEADTPSYIKTTIRRPFGIDTLNGLSASAQCLTSVNDSNVTLSVNSSGQTHSLNLGWSGLLPLSRGGLNNSTFTASQILIVDSTTSSVVSSGYRFNDSGISTSDIWSASKILNTFVSKSGDTMTGNLTVSSVYVNNNLTVNGNITVLGTASYIYTDNIIIEDNIITLNGTYSGSPVVNAGIEVNRGNTTSASLIWDETLDFWKLGLQGSESIVITEAGGGLTKTNNTLSVSYSQVSTNIQGNGLTANGDKLDVNVNADSLEITGDVIRVKDTITGGRTFTNGITVSGYGLNTSTWTASNILIVNGATNGVIGSGKVFNDNGTTTNDIWSASKIITQIASATASLNLSAVLSIGNSAGNNQIDMNSNKIINVATGSSNLDAVNYGQMINYVSSNGLYTLNGLSQSTQFFTSSNDTNVRMNIVSSGPTHSYNLTWNGLLPLNRGGLSNSTFTASQILIVDSTTSSVVSSGYRFNDSGTSSTDVWSANQIINNVMSITLTGARAANNQTNIYLRSGDGLPYNTTPFVLPFDATIKFISISTSNNATWTGEVRNNGTLITGASLTSTAQSATYSSYNVNVNAGTLLQLYMNGTGVNNPRMNVILVKR